MNLKVMVVTPQIMADIAALVARARQQPFSSEQLMAIKAGTLPRPGDAAGNVYVIPHGIRCAFSFEYQPALGLCRHLSVSVAMADGTLEPPPIFVGRQVMILFGFTKSVDELGKQGSIWLEADNTAINMLEPVTDPATVDSFTA